VLFPETAYEALNDLEMLAADVGNACLNAPTREKVYTTAGTEFGVEIQGQYVKIVRAFYGLKSSGAAWRAHLANTLQSMGFTSSLADPDVWFRAAVKPNGFEYYEYILAHVDDILAISHDPEKILLKLADFYHLQNGYAAPTRYLGAQVKQWYFPNDAIKQGWALSSEQYISQVSILRWMAELGRLDIYVHVALLSSYLVQPRHGHLEALYNIYGYLKQHNRSSMVFDDAPIN
jgi:hypothetical protein